MTMIFPVFLGIVVTLFFLLPVNCRPALLLLSSYAFCGWIDMRGLAVLILISIFTWRAGIRLERLQRKTSGEGVKSGGEDGGPRGEGEVSCGEDGGLRGECGESGRSKTRQVRGVAIFVIGYGERIKRGKRSKDEKVICQGEMIWKLDRKSVV